MKAVIMTSPGDTSVLQYTDIETPAIVSPGQIKVKIHAAGVNPIDTKIRARGLFFDDALPAVIGCDGAGEVIETGAHASNFKPGDRVWFCHGGLGREQGNYAEFKVMDETQAVLMPKNLSFEQAAAAPLVLITAWEALYDRAGVTKRQTVLIHAGAGGVGHVAIQLAKLVGATVLTTVSSGEKIEYVKSLGADHVIDYKEEDFIDATMRITQGKGADVIFDTVGSEIFVKSMEAAAHYGTLVTLLDPGDINFKLARNKNLRLCFELMLTPMLQDLPDARHHQMVILDRCRDYIESGHLQINVSEIIPLEKAAVAHSMIEAGHTRGKIVIKI